MAGAANAVLSSVASQASSIQRGSRKLSVTKIFALNACGLCDDEMFILKDGLQKRNAYAALLSETHRKHIGVEELDVKLGTDHQAWFFLGCNDKKSSHEKCGVGILLSSQAKADWIYGGEKILFSSSRNLAIRIRNQIDDSSIILVATYFPHSGLAEEILNLHYEELDLIRSLARNNESVIIGGDVNADVGRQRNRQSDTAAAVGPHGLPTWNMRGDKLASWSIQSNMKVARTFFFKVVKYRPTYFNFASHKPHSIDQFLVSESFFPKIFDARRVASFISSDHMPILLVFSWLKQVKIHAKPVSSRRRNFSALIGDEDKKVKKYDEFQIAFEKHMAVSNLLHDASGLISTRYDNLVSALQATVVEVVPLAEKPKPGWFDLAKGDILEAAAARNDAQQRFNAIKLRDVLSDEIVTARIKLRAARKKIALVVLAAKNQWIQIQASQLRGDSDACGGGAAYWQAVKNLLNGLQKPTISKPLRFRNQDGSIATSDEDNHKILKQHYTSVFNRSSCCDISMAQLIPQRPLNFAYDKFPLDSEILDAFQKLKAGKSGGNGLPSDAFKIIASSCFGFAILKGILREVWDSELAPQQWVILKLAILPKKGDSRDPNNTRGIALMEAMPKLLGLIILGRLNKHLIDSKEFSYQAGFISGRGCPDGQMPLKLALQKRQHCNLDTHVLFIDLIKAFDSVSRELMILVLGKFGVPVKMCNIIMALHSDVKVQLDYGKVSELIPNSMGVIQGGTLSPVLFIIFMHAFTTTLQISWQAPSFESLNDDVIGVRSNVRKVVGATASDSERVKSATAVMKIGQLAESFALPFLFYADDSAFLFPARCALIEGANQIQHHFRLWGLDMHVGSDELTSKTVAFYCPGCSQQYYDENSAKVVLRDGSFIHYVKHFQYLGSFFSTTLTDDLDIEKRIAKASAAFAALDKSIFSKLQISYTAKRAAYVAVVMSILLYGSETWAISSVMMERLRSFHHRCVRRMCKVNLWLTKEFSITTEKLLKRLGLQTIETYLHRRSLRWLGHVSRMSFDRLPRKMLTAWVKSPRLQGAPRLHYGSYIVDSLKRANIPLDSWMSRAQLKPEWRVSVNNIVIVKPRASKRISSS